MKAHILMDAIGNVSDKLIIDAEIAWRKKQRHGLKFIMISAACIILSMSMIIGGIILNRDFSMGDPQLTPPNNIPSDGIEGGGTPSTPSEGNGDITPDEPLSDSLEITGGNDARNVYEPSIRINRTFDIDSSDFVPITVIYSLLGRNPDMERYDNALEKVAYNFEFFNCTHMIVSIGDLVLKETTVEEFLKEVKLYAKFGGASYYHEETFYIDIDCFLEQVEKGRDQIGISVMFYNPDISEEYIYYENGEYFVYQKLCGSGLIYFMMHPYENTDGNFLRFYNWSEYAKEKNKLNKE